MLILVSIIVVLGSDNSANYRLTMITIIAFFFRRTVDSLVNESGCQMEPVSALRFRQNVMNGAWDEVSSDFLLYV